MQTLTLVNGNKFILDDNNMISVESPDGIEIERKQSTVLERELLAQCQFLSETLEAKALVSYRHKAGEPFFVLQGRDPQAPALVERWAADRARCPGEGDKALEAFEIAEAMTRYKEANPTPGLSKETLIQYAHPISFDPLLPFEPPIEVIDSIIGTGVAMKYVTTKTNQLIADAIALGVIVNIRNQSNWPPKMRDHFMVADYVNIDVYRRRNAGDN